MHGIGITRRPASPSHAGAPPLPSVPSLSSRTLGWIGWRFEAEMAELGRVAEEAGGTDQRRAMERGERCFRVSLNVLGCSNRLEGILCYDECLLQSIQTTSKTAVSFVGLMYMRSSSFVGNRCRRK